MVCYPHKHTGIPPHVPSQLPTACSFLLHKVLPGVPLPSECPVSPQAPGDLSAPPPHAHLPHEEPHPFAWEAEIVPGHGDAGGGGTLSCGTDVSPRSQVVLPGQLPPHPRGCGSLLQTGAWDHPIPCEGGGCWCGSPLVPLPCSKGLLCFSETILFPHSDVVVESVTSPRDGY